MKKYTIEEVKKMMVLEMKAYIKITADFRCCSMEEAHKYLKSSNIYVSCLMHLPLESLDKKGIWVCDYEITYDDWNEMIEAATGEKFDMKKMRTGAGFDGWVNNSDIKNNLNYKLAAM